uniref:DNA topoisomerase n=1 Tax=Cyprinus carpio TaxID=7962 RepID=A0A8C1L6K4_CYPCA
MKQMHVCNEKAEGELADTMGCCSLLVENITSHHSVECDSFLSFKPLFCAYDKQSNMCFLFQVFKILKLFMENKQEGDNLFDRLTTQMLNKHLSSFMPGLTAKVFRTYNASITLQQQLRELHNPKDNVAEKLLSYNRANRAVAFLSNHQLAPPKTFEQSMANQQAKGKARFARVQNRNDTCVGVQSQLRWVQDRALCVQATDREENKQIALRTSKLNYLDPRISSSIIYQCKSFSPPSPDSKIDFSWVGSLLKQFSKILAEAIDVPH